MEQCLNLLSSNSDEQRLVGLFLATKAVSGDDKEGVLQVFNAVGFKFISRLLKTGTKEEGEGNYLNLAVSILSAFCRVPELASKDEVINEVPSLVQVLSNKDGDVVVDACECLLAIAATSENGFTTVCQATTFSAIGNLLQESDLEFQGIPAVDKLLHFLATAITSANKLALYGKHLALVVPPLANQFSRQKSMLKFDMLELLRILLMGVPTRMALKDKHDSSSWTTNVRSGLAEILHSRVDPNYRNAALDLVEEMVEYAGEAWLVAEITIANAPRVSAERFLILLVELLRVEIEVLLGEISRSRIDQSERQSSVESLRKHQALATYYALVEHVINILAGAEESFSELQHSTTLIVATDQIIGVVLQFLEHAKDEGVSQGDELLSSVRLLGRYLADSPMSHNDRVLKLLGFILSITTEAQSPFHATRFLLPALCQITMAENGCEAVLSSRAHQHVISFIMTSIGNGEDAPINEACDILLNLLLKKESLLNEVHHIDFVPALPSLAIWAVKANQSMEIALATSLSVTVLGMTSEAALMSSLKTDDMELVFNLINRCLEWYHQDKLSQEEDLLDMVIAGCLRCLGRYPSLESILRRSTWISASRSSTQGGLNFRMLVGKLVA